jgi:hypothetical protein
VYAQDVEIVDDEELRGQFVLKAQAGLLRNSAVKINVKKGSG